MAPPTKMHPSHRIVLIPIKFPFVSSLSFSSLSLIRPRAEIRAGGRFTSIKRIFDEKRKTDGGGRRIMRMTKEVEFTLNLSLGKSRKVKDIRATWNFVHVQ